MQLGRIITVGDDTTQYVVVGYKDNSSYGDCSYNETYKLIKVEHLENEEFLTEDVINNDRTGKVFRVHVTGIERTPSINEVKNVAPFELTKEVRYYVRRKEAKQVTIYE